MKNIVFALLLFSMQLLAQTGATQGNAPDRGTIAPDKGAESTAQSTTAGADSSAQSASGADQQHKPADVSSGNSSLRAGTVINAQLSNAVDAKKVKQGDQVQAKTTQDVVAKGTVLLPRNTKLVGHVTHVEPATKDAPNSSVAIAFDNAVLKDGRQMPVRLSIEAIAPAPRAQVPLGLGEEGGAGAASAGGHGGYGTTGGMAGSAGGAAGSARDSSGRPMAEPSSVGASTANAANGTATSPGITTGGELTPTSKGVMGYPGLMIDSSASNATSGTVIKGDKKNVKLEKGTQILLRVTE